MSYTPSHEALIVCEDCVGVGNWKDGGNFNEMRSPALNVMGTSGSGMGGMGSTGK